MYIWYVLLCCTIKCQCLCCLTSTRREHREWPSPKAWGKFSKLENGLVICICCLLRKYCNLNSPVLVDGNQHALLVQIHRFVSVQYEVILRSIHYGNHWVTSSSSFRWVYDSKFKGSHLPSSLAHQLYVRSTRHWLKAGCEHHSSSAAVRVEVVAVAFFAIAFALH